MKRLATRYIASTIGLLLVALGIALSIISNLGTSPLSCPAYLLSLWGSLSMGEFTILINTGLILIQLGVLRGRFKLKYLMQIPASLVFGYLIDFWLWALSFLCPGTILARFSLIAAGAAISAFGVSLEVGAQGWMLSAEMTVYAFTKVCKADFSSIKIVMDCIYVVLAAGLSYLFFRNPFGSGEFTTLGDAVTARTPGTVIGIGTVLLAILPGYLMRWSDPVTDRALKKLRHRDEDRKWRRNFNNK